ncbi:MAG TPA: hypothetical protein VKS25_05195 [Solirubrobacteraceae bacterium]|nr:hypothetical protein [Solirubrobacteraceae bacterium]
MAGSGCAAAGPAFGSAQLNGDEWNLGGAAKDGSLDMSVRRNGAVTIAGDFARTPPCTRADCLAPSAYTWVRGYPNVLYGINQCFGATSPRPSPRLALPMRVDSIPRDLVSVTDYSAPTSGVTYDVAYDVWLHPTGTKRPCRTQGTLEILVWTDYDSRALPPASLEVGTATTHFAKTARSGSQTWSIYASNVFRSGRTAPWGGTLWFVPSRADVVARGWVSVDLSAVFAAAGRLLSDDYGWSALGSSHWLDTVSFGVEYGPSSGMPLDPSPSRFAARVSAYCLDVRASLLDAVCGSKGSQ